jgi:murein DD-endopeptidase MepM/ murein hydrolase activator NlpD
MHPVSPNGNWVVVGPGETIEAISRRAGVAAQDILEINGLSRSDQLVAGRMLYVLSLPPPPPATPEPLPSMVLSAGARPALQWPLTTVRIVIGSPFGTRDGRPHEGIDLPAPVGTPVFAAAQGRVVYAGNGIRGYGNLIVIRHPGDLLTVYAHNSLLLVSQGQPVAAGARVALVGQSGRATGPHLHFEVRVGQSPSDPMKFLGAMP